jgi:hypothetical protein
MHPNVLARSSARISALVPWRVVALCSLALGSTGCTVIKGIFKAGVWVGVLGVFAVLGLALYGVTKLRR